MKPVDQMPETILIPYLSESEKLLWCGRPGKGIRFRSSDILLVPFSLLWGGFVIFWNMQVWTAPVSAGGFQLFGLPFLAVGIYMIAGRFFLDAWVRSRTVYGLTNTRAIVVRKLWSEQLLTAPIDNSTRLNIGRGAEGDIEFGYRPPLTRSQSLSMWAPAMGSQVCFFGIADAMAVYKLAQSKLT